MSRFELDLSHDKVSFWTWAGLVFSFHFKLNSWNFPVLQVDRRHQEGHQILWSRKHQQSNSLCEWHKTRRTSERGSIICIWVMIISQIEKSKLINWFCLGAIGPDSSRIRFTPTDYSMAMVVPGWLILPNNSCYPTSTGTTWTTLKVNTRPRCFNLSCKNLTVMSVLPRKIWPRSLWASWHWAHKNWADDRKQREKRISQPGWIHLDERPSKQSQFPAHSFISRSLEDILFLLVHQKFKRIQDQQPANQRNRHEDRLRSFCLGFIDDQQSTVCVKRWHMPQLHRELRSKVQREANQLAQLAARSE